MVNAPVKTHKNISAHTVTVNNFCGFSHGVVITIHNGKKVVGFVNGKVTRWNVVFGFENNSGVCCLVRRKKTISIIS
jgi:hypothetical protein